MVFVELPKVGREVKKARSRRGGRSVKAASDVYAPIAGEVVEVNDDARRPTRRWSTPTPTAAAWFFKLKIADKSELDGLMDEAAYDAHTV